MNIVRTGVRSVWKRSWTFLGVKLQRFGSKRVIQVVAHLNNRSLTAKILQKSLVRVNVASLTDHFAHEHG